MNLTTETAENAENDKNNIEEFVDSVRHYCSLVENYNDYEVKGFLANISRSFSRLNDMTLGLQEIPPGEGTAIDTNFEVDELLNGIQKKFGDLKYLETFNPFKDKESTSYSVVYDIIEIYRDLKRELLKYDGGDKNDKQDALWQLQFGYASHWGRHMANAQRVIFFYLHDYFWGDS